jgi:hypothetical protein
MALVLITIGDRGAPCVQMEQETLGKRGTVSHGITAGGHDSGILHSGLEAGLLLLEGDGDNSEGACDLGAYSAGGYSSSAGRAEGIQQCEEHDDQLFFGDEMKQDSNEMVKYELKLKFNWDAGSST